MCQVWLLLYFWLDSYRVVGAESAPPSVRDPPETPSDNRVKRIKNISNYLPSVNLPVSNSVFIAEVRIGFFFRTPFSKTRVKPILSPGLPFLITYTSGSNWCALLISVSSLTVSFANAPLTTIDTAIIRSSSRPVSNFAKFTRKHLHHSFVFNEAADLQRLTLSKKGLRHRRFL